MADSLDSGEVTEGLDYCVIFFSKTNLVSPHVSLRAVFNVRLSD